MVQLVDELIGLNQAARILGYSPSGLRRIVEATRRRTAGRSVTGPTIKFFQPGPRGEIKFSPQWIKEFIAENTVDPAAKPRPATRRTRKRSSLATTPDTHGFDVGA